MRTIKLFTFAVAMMLQVGGVAYAQSTVSTKTTQTTKQQAISGNFITGRVQDNVTNEPIIGATVIIDGTTKGTVTDEKGAFFLKDVTVGKEITLNIDFIGYKQYKLKCTPEKGRNGVGVIGFLVDALLTDEVVVQGTAPIALQMGDTTQYNAGAYKTNPDAYASDLLNKMPGFSADGGKLTVGGEEVTQVYVDGKGYFKDDVSTAISSLPASIIESVQLFDEKSDESRFTGVDDGNRTKTINIVTTTKQKNAYLGDYIVGGGHTIGDATDLGTLYNFKANTNIFQGDNRFTLNLGANNINQSATTGSRYYGGGSGSDGLQKAIGLSANFSGEYKKSEYKKTELNISYSFSNTQSDVEKIIDRLYYETDEFGDSESYGEKYVSGSIGNSHMLRFDVESDINEKNRIFFRGNGRLSDSKTGVVTDAETYLGSVLSNTSFTDKTTNSDSYSTMGSLTWFRSLVKKHSLILSANYSLSRSESDQFLIGDTEQWEDDLLSSNIEYDQETLNLTNNNNAGLKLSYTYKINGKSGFTAGINSSYTWSDSDKKTYLLDATTLEYTDIDDDLSNVFDRDYYKNSIKVGYSYYEKDKINLSVNFDYEKADLINNQTYPLDEVFENKYNFYSPNSYIRLDYYFTKSKRISISYKGNSNLPSITQLQDVVDNTNPLLVTRGNADLEQSFASTLSMTYNVSNITKSTSFNAFVFANTEANYITDQTVKLTSDEYINGVLVSSGARVSSPVNTSGYWSLRSGAYYSFTTPKILCNFTIGGRYSYSRLPSIIDGVKSFSNSNDGSVSLKLNSNISNNLDFSISSNSSVSIARNSLSSESDNTYFKESVGVAANWIIAKGFFINVDYTYNFYKYSSNEPDDPNYSMLNLGIGKKFLKKQNLELRVSGFDMLNQSQALTHTIASEYVQDAISNVLQRYLMFTVSYKFNTFKGQMPNVNSDRRNRGGMDGSSMRGMGGMGGGPGGR
ncbi:MAG: TonB-dependent receptor [Rikenellaceae bacterium]